MVSQHKFEVLRLETNPINDSLWSLKYKEQFCSFGKTKSNMIYCIPSPGEVSWWPSGENLWWWPTAFSCSTAHPNAGQERNATYFFWRFSKFGIFPLAWLAIARTTKTIQNHLFGILSLCGGVGESSTELFYVLGGHNMTIPHFPTCRSPLLHHRCSGTCPWPRLADGRPGSHPWFFAGGKGPGKLCSCVPRRPWLTKSNMALV